MAVTLTYRKRNYSGRYKMCILKYSVGAADTTNSATAVQTNMKQIYGITCSAPPVTDKFVRTCVVAGGAATITVEAPGVTANWYVIAWGI